MLQAVTDRIIVNLSEDNPTALIYTNEPFVRNKGTVVSVGPRVSVVRPGDKIIFHRFDELPLPEKNQVVVRESSVLGIYTD